MIYYQWSVWLEARRDLVIDDIRPRTSAAGFEFLDTKVNFFYGFPEHPVGGCIDHWPPDLSPRLVSPRQLRVAKGDRIAVTFFLRTTRVGDFSSNGLVIDYHQGGQSFRTTNRVTTLTVHVRDRPDELTAGCDPRRSVDTWVR